MRALLPAHRSLARTCDCKDLNPTFSVVFAARVLGCRVLGLLHVSKDEHNKNFWFQSLQHDGKPVGFLYVFPICFRTCLWCTFCCLQGAPYTWALKPWTQTLNSNTLSPKTQKTDNPKALTLKPWNPEPYNLEPLDLEVFSSSCCKTLYNTHNPKTSHRFLKGTLRWTPLPKPKILDPRQIDSIHFPHLLTENNIKRARVLHIARKYT